MNLRPALSRPMDWANRSNLFATAIIPVFGGVAGLAALIASESFADAFGWGFAAAGAGFLAWAIAREVHPDRVWVATVAAFLAPVGLLWGRADLLASATILLVARAVAGTTGRSLRVADLLLLAAVEAPVMWRESGPVALGVGAAGLALTVLWHERHRMVHVAAAVMYAAGAAAAVSLGDGSSPAIGAGAILLWIGLGAGVIALTGPDRVQVGTDRAGGTIAPMRVRVARLVVTVGGCGIALWHEPAAAAAVFAAMVATALRPR